MGISARAVVGQPYHAQSVFYPARQMVGRENWIGTLHTQQETQRSVVRPVLPFLEAFLDRRPIAQHSADTALFEKLVVSQLSFGHGAGNLLSAEVNGRLTLRIAPSQNSDERDTDLPATHLGQGYRSFPASLPRHASL